MFCTKCGTQLQEGAIFCTQCGSQVANSMNSQVNYQMNQTTNENSVVSRNLNIIRIIASVFVILSTFLPYASALSFQQSLLDGGDGVLFIGLTVAVIVMDIIKKSKIAFVLSIITLALTIYEVIDTVNAASQAYGLLNYEIGFFILIIGSIGMVVAGPLMKVFKK